MDIEQKITELEKKIQKLEQEVEKLNYFNYMLVIGKKTDPKYPYYQWLMELKIPEEKKMLMEGIMGILALRLEKKDVPDIFKKEVPGIPFEKLYGEDVPHYEDVVEIVQKVLGLENELHVVDLLKVLYVQGKFRELCKHLLTEAGQEVPSVPVEN